MVTKAKSIAVLRDSWISDSSLLGGADLKNFITRSTSHVPEYFGFGGLELKIPFISLRTVGCFPKSCPFTCGRVPDSMDR